MLWLDYFSDNFLRYLAYFMDKFLLPNPVTLLQQHLDLAQSDNDVIYKTRVGADRLVGGVNVVKRIPRLT